MMIPINCESHGLAEFLQFEYRPPALEYLVQPYECICSQSATSARLDHLWRVIDAVHFSPPFAVRLSFRRSWRIGADKAFAANKHFQMCL